MPEKNDRPWVHEPDHVQWVTLVGLEGMIKRGPLGALNGYVAVGPEHPLYRRVNSVYDTDLGLTVHGGVTYAGHFEGNDTWWIGFDCAHGGDLLPYIIGRYPECEYGVYRDLAYVKREVETLACQIQKAAKQAGHEPEAPEPEARTLDDYLHSEIDRLVKLNKELTGKLDLAEARIKKMQGLAIAILFPDVE
jgi:hypothetical protein